MVTTLFEKIYYDVHGEMEKACFSLYIDCIKADHLEESLFWVMSDIVPDEMLSHFRELLSPKFVFKAQSDPNQIYLEELLDFISKEIMSDNVYRPFFYPDFFFDKEQNVKPEICRHFSNARIDVRRGKLQIINTTDKLHKYYLSQLIKVPLKFLNEKKFSMERISRKNFELSLTDFEKAQEYVEIYTQTSRFKCLRKWNKIPNYYLALDSKNQPILAIAAMNKD